jgi:hypothetical protein
VLALQRAAGNAAVSNLLQREDKTPATGPSDFTVSGGEPKSSGTSVVSPGKEGKARIQSPDVTFSGSVSINDDKTLGTTAYLGYIQNLAHSDRGAVYRRGGTADGEVVGEDHTGMSGRWDAVNDPVAEDKGEMKPAAGVFPPFYWKPGQISDSNTSANPAVTDPAAHDRPEFSMPVTKGPGRITEFKGKDEFKLGLAVKKDETVWMLRAYDWSISWAANVDASLNGAGEAVKSSAVKDAIADGPNAGLKDWSLDPKKPGDPFEGFATVDLAMQRSPAELMSWLLAAQKHDQVTHRNICQALDAKDAAVKVNFTCNSKHNSIMADKVHIRAEGSGGGYSSKTVELGKGDSDSVSVSIKELFGSAGAITEGSRVTVEVSHMDGPTGTESISPPFNGSRSFAVGDGNYTVSASVG